MILKFTFTNLWPIIAAISLIIVSCLYIMGKDRKDDEERYINDIKGLIARVRYCPANPDSFKTFRDEFRVLSKSKFARRIMSLFLLHGASLNVGLKSILND